MTLIKHVAIAPDISPDCIIANDEDVLELSIDEPNSEMFKHFKNENDIYEVTIKKIHSAGENR